VALLFVTIAVVGTMTVFSGSRGGQLVFLTATGVYFVRRFGWRGIMVGAIFGAGMLMMGGRGGDDAEASSLERTRCMYMGMQMFRESPLFGVGQGQFTEHHVQTAHNSYALVAAELGLPGMLLWVALVYMSVKIPIAALRQAERGDIVLDGAGRAWAVALIASLAGMCVGVFFLSFSYHNVLWISLGLAGAYFGCVRAHEPRFEVKISWKEVGGMLAFCCVLIAMLTTYSGYMLAKSLRRRAPRAIIRA
jgi:O-antigen ligase